MIWPLGAVFAAVGIAALKLFHRRLFGGNFGVVDPGRVYRCSRRRADLAAVLAACRPATILNLGHNHDRHQWTVEQMREARRWGVELNEVSIRCDRRPSREALLAILDVFDNCRFPVLVHCTDGADRTALACALYLMAVRADPPDVAFCRAFSLEYGHIPVCGIEHLHEPFVEYKRWLENRRLAHDPSRLLAWLENEYHPSCAT